MSKGPPARRKLLLLIDSATSGTAGAYVDAIHRRLIHRDAVEIGVSYYFPFGYGKRIFFRYSELAAQETFRLGRARLYVRFIELLAALGRLLVWVASARVPVVCYALSSNLWIEFLFLWLVRHAVGARVYLICHDVIPFVAPGEDYAANVRKRRRFYELADRLIVHNRNSAEELRTAFGIADAKIDEFPFPLYDLSRMKLPRVDVLAATTHKRFLFIGHLRVEKGVEALLDAWSQFRAHRSDAELVIAGRIPPGRVYDFADAEAQGVTLLNRYLSDLEYLNLIRQADCVVLPYLRGTNSAVVSTVLAARKNLVVSDIEMFRNNPLIPPASFFRCNDSGSLAERLTYFCDLGRDDQSRMDTEQDRRIEEFEALFRVQVNAVLDPSAVAGGELAGR